MQFLTRLILSSGLEGPVDEEVVLGFPQVAVEVTRHRGGITLVDRNGRT